MLGNTDPNTVDYYGEIPLSRVACSAPEGVVKMLLEREDVNANAANRR